MSGLEINEVIRFILAVSYFWHWIKKCSCNSSQLQCVHFGESTRWSLYKSRLNVFYFLVNKWPCSFSGHHMNNVWEVLVFFFNVCLNEYKDIQLWKYVSKLIHKSGVAKKKDLFKRRCSRDGIFQLSVSQEVSGVMCIIIIYNVSYVTWCIII